MLTRLAAFLFFFLPLASQAQCDFNLGVMDSVQFDSAYIMDGFVITGVKGKQANILATDIDLYRGSKIIINRDELARHLTKVCRYKKALLHAVEVRKTNDGSGHVLLKFIYTAPEDSLLKK